MITPKKQEEVKTLSPGEELVAVMRSLAEVMDQETELLQRKDVPVLTLLNNRKMELVRLFEKNMACLIALPDGLKTMDPALSLRLNEGRKLCEAAARKNASTIKGVLEATEGVVSAIVDTVVKKTKENGGYTDPRAKKRGPEARDEVCPPVAFCRSI